MRTGYIYFPPERYILRRRSSENPFRLQGGSRSRIQAKGSNPERFRRVSLPFPSAKSYTDDFCQPSFRRRETRMDSRPQGTPSPNRREIRNQERHEKSSPATETCSADPGEGTRDAGDLGTAESGGGEGCSIAGKRAT